MLCDICGKNQATVHLTEIVDEQMNELHLCEQCARQKSAQMEQQFGLADLLAGLSEFQKPAEEKEIVSLKCPNCGLTYNEFKKIGRLGCSECYTAFKKYLGPLLKRIHGSNSHSGKSPAKMAKEPRKDTLDIQELRFKLSKAIEAEQYEEAASLRDQIRSLQEKQPREPKEKKQ
ncbi:MAG: UvrB/UvrC motif-containing protein [Candidatus Omnitrophica bacterium]|nr:UvrB/UvrC motif-containing protein [Candidatus Omnitrophota bacterium]